VLTSGTFSTIGDSTKTDIELAGVSGHLPRDELKET
jgi:hypothetical protein